MTDPAYTIAWHAALREAGTILQAHLDRLPHYDATSENNLSDKVEEGYGNAVLNIQRDLLSLPAPDLRAALASMVKPLEWVYDERRGVWDAQDGFGRHYTASDSQWFHGSLWEFIWVDGGDEAAKAAAQADYVKRGLAIFGVTE